MSLPLTAANLAAAGSQPTVEIVEPIDVADQIAASFAPSYVALNTHPADKTLLVSHGGEYFTVFDLAKRFLNKSGSMKRGATAGDCERLLKWTNAIGTRDLETTRNNPEATAKIIKALNVAKNYVSERNAKKAQSSMRLQNGRSAAGSVSARKSRAQTEVIDLDDDRRSAIAAGSNAL